MYRVVDARALEREAHEQWISFEKSRRAVKHITIWITIPTTARRIYFESNPDALVIDPSTIFLIIQVLMFLYRLWNDRPSQHVFKGEDDIRLIEAKIAEFSSSREKE